MKRPILIHPDPRLKKVCDPVSDVSDELRALADDMLETMYDAPGIGLAAPQVGVMSRLRGMGWMKVAEVRRWEHVECRRKVEEGVLELGAAGKK